MLETRQLYYFKMVADHLNFTKAAETLNMTQPPLSYQIKKLEDYLGTKLFHRNNRSVQLTPAGKYFYEVAEKTLNNLSNQVDTVKKIGAGEVGNLRIGFGGSVVYDILPKIIKHIHSGYPNLNLTVQQLTTSQQIFGLKNSDIDIGILVPPINNLSINTLSIRKEEFIVCLYKEHPLAHRKEPLNITLFRDDNIVMTPPEAGIGYYNSIISLCKMGGFSPNITQTAQEQHTIVSLVASGMGIAFVPISTSKINHEDVVYRKLVEKSFKETAIAWNVDYNNPSINLFLSIIKNKIL